MKKILVIGSKGQLGNELQDISKAYSNYKFFFYDKDELDIVQENAVFDKVAELKPDFLINCAAYTAVDKAETDRDMCFAINADAVKYLAKACTANNVKFIHISTDYVFNGAASEPYKEDHPTNPQNVYGQSKLQGELNVQQNNPEAIIIRTAWVYSFYGNNFVKTMLRLMQSKAEISVVADQKGSPTYAADLADTIMQIVQSGNWQPGIYHYSNDGVITWYEFAQAIKELSQSKCIVHPITTAQYPTPAKRPTYSVLDTSKIEEVYSIKLQPWKVSLKKCLALLSK